MDLAPAEEVVITTNESESERNSEMEHLSKSFDFENTSEKIATTAEEQIIATVSNAIEYTTAGSMPILETIPNGTEQNITERVENQVEILSPEVIHQKLDHSIPEQDSHIDNNTIELPQQMEEVVNESIDNLIVAHNEEVTQQNASADVISADDVNAELMHQTPELEKCNMEILTSAVAEEILDAAISSQQIMLSENVDHEITLEVSTSVEQKEANTIEAELFNITQSDSPNVSIETNGSGENVEFIVGDLLQQDISSRPQTGTETVVVVASEEGNKEIVIHTDGEIPDGTAVTLQEITDESGQVYFVQTMDNVLMSNDGSNEIETIGALDTEKVKNVPSHVLGRNIINPSVDPFRNGRAPPKPRLGVKIPYRNLTSQIVSKQEITEEILERSRRNSKGHVSAQNLFARKLTQTLAKKLAPSPKTSPSTSKPEKALDNSDLLAILEGDDEKPKEKPVKMTRELEREIALKQLSELPDDPVPLRDERKRLAEKAQISKNKRIESGKPHENQEDISKNAGKESTTKSVAHDKEKQITQERVKQDAREEMKQSTHSTEKETINAKQTQSPDKKKPMNPEKYKQNISPEKQKHSPFEKQKQASIERQKQVVPDKSKQVSMEKQKSEKHKHRDDKEILIIPDQIDDDSPESEPEDELKAPRFPTNVPLKTYTRKRKTSSDEAATPPHSANSGMTQLPGNSSSTKKIDLPSTANNYVTKSSRVIKKKIIWDPDEVTPRKFMKTSENVGKKEINSSKKFEEIKKLRKAEIVKTIEKIKKIPGDAIKKIADTPKKTVDTSSKSGETPKKVDVLKKTSETVKRIPESAKKMGDAVKKSSDIQKNAKEVRQESPKKKIFTAMRECVVDVSKRISPTLKKLNYNVSKNVLKSPQYKLSLKGKKRLTEIDRLLMDEGAVNMLYSLNTAEEDQSIKKKKKSLISKTNELLNDLQTHTSEKESPKALRKKDSPVIVPPPMPKKIITPSLISRQKSKDSNRSSLHTPPASPLTAEASRIIRRHSSSSFSSGDEDDKEWKMKQKKRKSDAEAVIQKKKLKKETIESDKSGSDSTQSYESSDKDSKSTDSFDTYKTVKVQRLDEVIKIILLPNMDGDVYFEIEMMQELMSILKELEDDSDCKIATILSEGAHFTKGLNYKSLIVTKELTRKTNAKKLAIGVRDFLLSLLNFPKVLIAGIKGPVIGVGVTMLPLFDIVIASDDVTFSLPYSKLGCIAEGGSLLSCPHQNALVFDLLYTSKILDANSGLKHGLISNVVPSTHFQQEVNLVVQMISKQSLQLMEATKKQLRQRKTAELTAAIKSETETLVQHWTSLECQTNFANL